MLLASIIIISIGKTYRNRYQIEDELQHTGFHSKVNIKYGHRRYTSHEWAFSGIIEVE